ncbi:MAG: tryptophan 7-halogenase [Polyangiaceae bacterium]|nr:tryptophan 7-halogenase [Polyangiaceae bacterium]
MNASFDVAVVGGGPSGAIAALRMAQLGHRVCLVEKSRFPRRHLGESLTPGVLPMLASIGAAHGVTIGAARVESVSVHWEREATQRRDPGARGWLVDRGVFDAALLTHARAAGVVVCQPAAARRASPHEDGWVLELDTLHGATRIDARFLMDAGGRGSRICVREFSGARVHTGPRTFAIHGYFRGKNLPTQPSLEAIENAWCWGVPIPDGSYNALAFVDADSLRDRSASTETKLIALLRPSSIGSAIANAALDGPARVVDATASIHACPVGLNWLRVGDAAMTLDPLSSSGVQKAIQSALAGAIVANTLLRHPEDRALTIRFYEEHLSAASSRHARWAAQHYSVAAERFSHKFWRDRSAALDEVNEPIPPREPVSASSELRVSAAATWRDVPCLGAERVELRRAMDHPGFDGPAAFLGEVELAPLFELVPPRFTLTEVAARWTARIPASRALAIAQRLWERGVFEPT